MITQFLYQVNWFLEQEDNSKLERTTIEEQLSSESWSFVTKINQFKSLVRVLEKFGAMQTIRTPEQTNSSSWSVQCRGPGVREYFVVHALYDRQITIVRYQEELETRTIYKTALQDAAPLNTFYYDRSSRVYIVRPSLSTIKVSLSLS